MYRADVGRAAGAQRLCQLAARDEHTSVAAAIRASLGFRIEFGVLRPVIARVAVMTFAAVGLHRAAITRAAAA